MVDGSGFREQYGKHRSATKATTLVLSYLVLLMLALVWTCDAHLRDSRSAQSRRSLQPRDHAKAAIDLALPTLHTFAAATLRTF